ncbi:hypothetical protein FOL47_000785 [Perkinsus chesapeaki]|uniref:K Homology domain-containing protein n=1 Tax=Perkinsus chesapeaki TaxID=330153 RepID=A0A7J6MKT0_PERCH|nr:hypothetical protein FOL47_000785 [Perkinsus chesapeaki]
MSSTVPESGTAEEGVEHITEETAVATDPSQGTNSQIPEVETKATPAAGEKRPREDELETSVESSNEEPPAKKVAGEGEGEVTKKDTEVHASTADTTPEINDLPTEAPGPGASPAAPIGPLPKTSASPMAVPIGPAGPPPLPSMSHPSHMTNHQWGADAGPFRDSVKVPQHCVAQIIGRGGANLMSTRNTTRCHIECDQRTKDEGYSFFHIDAETKDSLMRGVRAIERQTKPMHPLEGEVQQVVIVPDERVGDILGPRGCVVKVISDQTGGRIDIQQRGLQRGEPRECRVVGTPEEVQAGIQMIEGIRDGSIDVKSIIRDFEEANPAFRREQEMRNSGGGWMSGGKGNGPMWDSPYGAHNSMPQQQQQSHYGSQPGMDQWSHLLPASGPVDRAVIDVPADCAGMVIGRGGENIKGLQAECSLSECQIEKGIDQRTPRKMTLQGPATGVQAALMQLSMKTNGRIVTIVQPQHGGYQPQPMMQQQPQQQPQGMMPQGYGMQQQQGGYNMGMPYQQQQQPQPAPAPMDPMAQYYSQWANYQQQMNVNNQQNAQAWKNYYASIGNPQTPPYRGGQSDSLQPTDRLVSSHDIAPGAAAACLCVSGLFRDGASCCFFAGHRYGPPYRVRSLMFSRLLPSCLSAPLFLVALHQSVQYPVLEALSVC